MTKVARSCRGTSSLAFPIFLGFRQLAASNRLRCPRFMDQPREGPRLSKPKTSNPSRHRSMAARCTLKLTTGIEALPTGREDFARRDRLLRNSLQPQSRVLWDQAIESGLHPSAASRSTCFAMPGDALHLDVVSRRSLPATVLYNVSDAQ